MYILYNSNIREMKTFTFYDALSKSYSINVLMQIFSKLHALFFALIVWKK